MSSILALTRDGILCSRAVYVAAALGIPDRLKDGPRTAEELADLVHAHAPSLRRVLRFLAGRGLFHEDARGRFRLTPLGDTLRSDRADSTRPLALFWNEDYRWRAYGDVLHAVATGQTAVEHLYGAPIFEFLSAHPEHARGFDAAMTAVSTHAIPAVLDAYDFRRIRVLVDVGGGQGSLLAGILRAHPGMRGVLVDLPPVAARARERSRSFRAFVNARNPPWQTSIGINGEKGSESDRRPRAAYAGEPIDWTPRPLPRRRRARGSPSRAAWAGSRSPASSWRTSSSCSRPSSSS